MGTHRSRFTISGSPEKLCDWTQSYFEGRGFVLTPGSEKPRVLFLRRGTALGRHRIEECRTELQVSFQPEDTEVAVDCHYDIRVTDLLHSDHDFLEQEVEGLRRSILAHGAGRRCAKCGSPLAAEFQVCPYCGTKPAVESRCPGCGRDITLEFNFCPACGAALKEKVISLR